MSEMEVSVFRQRSMEAINQKARRGEYFSTVGGGIREMRRRPYRQGPRPTSAGGYFTDLSKFSELQTVLQVLVWDSPATNPLAGSTTRARKTAHPLESAGISHAPPHSDEPRVRGRLRVRAPRNNGRPCRGKKTDHPDCPPNVRLMGSTDQGSS